jgi:RNA polymerase sigma-70 factor (ECF subfamily)
MNIIDRFCATRALKARIADRRGRLYRVAYAWCGERHLADDLVQEAMTRAMDKHGQLRDPSRLDSWLYSILNNCWREHLRTRRPDLNIEDQDLECDQCPERVNLSGELAEQIILLMARLPEGQRRVLALVALEELSYRDVAETLDIPIGTVMSRLSRARRFLAERMSADAKPVATARPYLRRVK